MGWNAAWSSSSDRPVWAFPGQSLSSQWTPQSEPIECMHHVQLQGDAAPNAIWFACMVVQRVLKQEFWSKYRASTFFSEIRELWNFVPFIFLLCAPWDIRCCKRLQTNPGWHLNTQPDSQFSPLACFSVTFCQTLYSQPLIDMLLQHCQGHICHLDFSRAAWHSPPPLRGAARVFAKLEISVGDITGVILKAEVSFFLKVIKSVTWAKTCCSDKRVRRPSCLRLSRYTGELTQH